MYIVTHISLTHISLTHISQTGLMRRFRHVVEERVNAGPDKYNAATHFQKSWSGEKFSNADWVKTYGDGRAWTGK